jgi:wyosine [tRNA(Phe)-imidazoG37] synthetase (radical SAM superfamily)
MSFLFGPVPSRRLGRSLGVDLIPPKTCCFDCVYCEVGPTTQLTLRRRPHQTGAILRELRRYLAQCCQLPDVITLAGSGEPTLNAGLGEIIAGVKAVTEVPVAVLTNGALLHLSEVRRELALADIVLPSLDAASEATFRRINRPHPKLSLDLLLTGLRAFRREYAGQIWLEVMLLKGVNDSQAELTALRREIALLAPDRLQLNTAVRPVVEAWAEPLSQEAMARAAAFLGHGAEVIAAFDRVARAPRAVPDAAYLEMLARRPMTAGDLAQTLGLPLPQVERRLAELAGKGFVSAHRYRNTAYFRATPRSLAENGQEEAVLTNA